MKKVLIALTVTLTLGFLVLGSKSSNSTEQAGLAAANMNEKVTICHNTGNGSSHPITISIHAVPAHIANHGDVVGDCDGGGTGTITAAAE